jgi:hypothetical protein
MRKIILATVAVLSLAVFFLNCGGSSNNIVHPPQGSSAAVAFLQQQPNSFLLYPVLGKFSGSQFTTSMVKDPSTGNYVSAAIGSIFLSSKGDKATFEVFGGTDNANPTYQWDIYVGTIDGANLVQVTNDANNDEVPQFNPSATKVIFSSYRSDTWFTVIRNADGTGEQVLPNPANSYGTWHASYSPDGTKIAVEAWGTNEQGIFDGIFMMNADGSNATMLTNGYAAGCWCQDEMPVFTSDGTHIVFSRASIALVNQTPQVVQEDVYIMKADGTSVTRLSNGVGVNFDPAVVYDATLQADRVLFGSNRDKLSVGSAGYELYSISTTGTNVTRLTNNSLYDGFSIAEYDPTEVTAAARVRHEPRTPVPVERRLQW